VSALQEQFVTEARELVRQATDDLIALERNGASSERIDGVFRAFHTLKGSAGMVELPAMSLMLHAAEDLLAGIRHGTLGVNAEIVDTALACLDQVSRWVDDFEDAGAVTIAAAGPCRSATAAPRTRFYAGRDFGLARMGVAPDRDRARRVGVKHAGTAASGHGHLL